MHVDGIGCVDEEIDLGRSAPVRAVESAGVWQLDHLQYGFFIPEPSAGIMLFGASILLLRRKKKIPSSQSDSKEAEWTRKA